MLSCLDCHIVRTNSRTPAGMDSRSAVIKRYLIASLMGPSVIFRASLHPNEQARQRFKCLALDRLCHVTTHCVHLQHIVIQIECGLRWHSGRRTFIQSDRSDRCTHARARLTSSHGGQQSPGRDTECNRQGSDGTCCNQTQRHHQPLP